MAKEYVVQDWNNYDESLTVEENLKRGAIAEADKMRHMEEGISQASKPYTVGTVSQGEPGTLPMITINDDRTIDFVIPKGDPGDQGLQGEPGIDGEDGRDFGINGIYDSIDAMYADINNIDTNSMVIIVNPSNTEDNGKVYIKKEDGQLQFFKKFEGTKKGDKGDPGEPGANGESAYEIWLRQPGNAGKSETEFLKSLQGEVPTFRVNEEGHLIAIYND